MGFFRWVVPAMLLAAVVVACAPAAPAAAPTAAAQAKPAASAEMTPAKYVLAASGNEARFRGKEVLLGQTLGSEAVGKTAAVTGSIAFDKTGAVDPAQSKLSIDATSFVSVPSFGVGARNAEELARVRDAFVRTQMLHADKNPTVTFAPTRVTGLSAPFPTAGKAEFQMTGDLTANGVKKPVTFDVSAAFSGNDVTGVAKGVFKFPDFDIQKPTLASVLTIDDTVSLEFDFKATKQG